VICVSRLAVRPWRRDCALDMVVMVFLFLFLFNGFSTFVFVHMGLAGCCGSFLCLRSRLSRAQSVPFHSSSSSSSDGNLPFLIKLFSLHSARTATRPSLCRYKPRRPALQVPYSKHALDKCSASCRLDLCSTIRERLPREIRDIVYEYVAMPSSPNHCWDAEYLRKHTEQ
jgi:hypothetical protein